LLLPSSTANLTPVNPPPNAVSIRNGDIWLTPSGIVIVRSKPVDDTLDDAILNVKAVLDVSNGLRRPLLVDSRLLKATDKLANQYYRGALTAKSVVALAFLSNSVVSLFLANLFMSFSLKLPMRMFREEKAALDWLLGFVRRPDSHAG
jgi:hypothetical protein